MDGGDVLGYLDANEIEAEITAAVAECVEQGAAQPLAFLAEMSDERIRRMQEQLLHYRWAMAYRRPAAPSAVHSIAQELQEHVSQNPVRQS